MFESTGEDQRFTSVEQFYNGKNVFLTGATGFVGTAILETLLRCFPGIKSIYILLRSKKNVNPEIRKEKVLSKKIFEKLKKETPEFLEKVHLIAGDISLPNLGMNEDDVQLLIQEVSIVFHCAAVISFAKPLEFILKNNVLSLSSVLELSKKMKKIEAFVYTSTIYSNCNHLNLPLKEEIIRLPFPANRFIDALKKGDSAMLQELVAYCKPDWPNTYTFSKCLAENVIMDMASNLPIAIIRPSIVIFTWKQPMPGYVEENSGICALSIGPLYVEFAHFSIPYISETVVSLFIEDFSIRWRYERVQNKRAIQQYSIFVQQELSQEAGKGFIKVLQADPNHRLNMVPADITANAHVLAAWSVGTKRCASPFVANCTANESLHVKFGEFTDIMSELALRFPFPKSFEQFSNPIIVPNKYLYYILSAYYHYLPAIVLDGMLRILGKKPRLYSLYRFLDTTMSCLKFFIFTSFEYERKNFEYLDTLIQPEDRKDLSLDFSNDTLLEKALSVPEGSSFYDWKTDRKSQSERQRIVQIRHMLIKSIQWIFLMTFCLLIYWVFSRILL